MFTKSFPVTSINLRVDNCLDFLNKLKDRSNFSEVWKENIQMSILDKEENFGLFSLKRMKLLDYWFEIVKNHTYIDMLEDGRIKTYTNTKI